VTLAVELEVDAAVDDSLTVHPFADACIAKELGAALLENARADSLFAVLAVTALEHDRLDTFELEQPREREARRSGTDDPDLRLRHSSSTRWAIANAPFAAGTPQ